MSTIKTRGTIRLDVDACKGCELCIPACPPDVLTMSTARNELGVHVESEHPARPDDRRSVQHARA